MVVSPVTLGAAERLSDSVMRTTSPWFAAALLWLVRPTRVLVTKSVAAWPLSLTVASHGPSR